ncbi:hypothetical protein HZS_6705, partial [Henneguya salminicola]
MICIICVMFLIISSSLENNDEKYEVKFSSTPIKLENVFPNNTYFIPNFMNKSYLCNLPDNEFETPEDHEKILTPNEILKFYQGQCILFLTNNYWDFSICIGENLTQFHKDEGCNSYNNSDGEIHGDNYFEIGYFESEKNWENIDLNFRSIVKKAIYHEQKYVNGSMCSRNIPRRAEVRYFCQPEQKDISVVSYYEETACDYVFNVQIKQLCSIPIFSQGKSRVSKITCQPQYLTTKNEQSKKHMIDMKTINTIDEVNILNVIDEDIKKILQTIIPMSPVLTSNSHENMNNQHFDTYDVIGDTKMIIEKEGDRMVHKWRISIHEKVSFNKILERAASIQRSSIVSTLVFHISPLPIIEYNSLGIENLGCAIFFSNY